MRVDHVAIDAAKLEETVQWYVGRLGAEILYRDATWAFLRIGGMKLALLTPGQHPPHLAISVTPEELEKVAKREGRGIRPHRDGTASVYVMDPSGNAVEFIAYLPGHAYERAIPDCSDPEGT